MRSVTVAHQVLVAGLMALAMSAAQAAEPLSLREIVPMALAVKKWYGEAGKILPDLPKSKVLDQALKPIAMVDTVRKAAVQIPDMILPPDDTVPCSYTPPPLPRFLCQREECGTCIGPLHDAMLSLETTMSGVCTGQLILESDGKIFFAATRAQVGALNPSAIARVPIGEAEKKAKEKLKRAARATRQSYEMQIALLSNEMREIAQRIVSCHPDLSKGQRWWLDAQQYLDGLAFHYGTVAPSGFDKAVWGGKFWQE